MPSGKAIKKVIAEEKARNGYVVISDKKGGIKKVPAKDFLTLKYITYTQSLP